MTHLELSEAVDMLAQYDADQIAELMRLAGIKGTPQEPHACPLSVWFSMVVDDYPDIAVEERFVSDATGLFDYDLPQGAQDFVTYFDTGSYSELVAS